MWLPIYVIMYVVIILYRFMDYDFFETCLLFYDIIYLSLAVV